MSTLRRRTTAGAGLALVALLAAACGGESGSESSSGDGDVTLQFWSHTHEPMNVLNERLIEEYESANPGVTIEYTVMPNADFFTRMLTTMSTGAGPDVVNMDDSNMRGEYIPKDLVAPVDPAAFGAADADEVRARYADGALDGASGPDGGIYGIPSEFNGSAFAVNAQHFADAGLDPADPPETWDDVVAYGEALAAAGHENAFNFNYLHSGWYTQQLNLLLNQTGGSILDDSGAESALTSPESQAAVELWRELATAGIGDPNAATRDPNNPYADLAAGNQSMAVVYPWAMEQIAQSNPDTYENLVVVPLPQVDPSNPAVRGYGYYWGVNSQSEQQQAAWEFVAFLADHSEDWLAEASFVQPVQGWQETEAAQAIDFIDVWAGAYAGVTFDEVGPHWEEVRDAMMNMINDVVFNGADVASATENASGLVEQSVNS
jgi:multiple sugar transport system substrate-binding protein